MSYTHDEMTEGPQPVRHASAEGGPYQRSNASHRVEPMADDIYPDESKEAVERSSSRKQDVESNETDIKAEDIEGGDVLSEEERPGKVKAFIARHAKAIRVGIHITIAVVMTG